MKRVLVLCLVVLGLNILSADKTPTDMTREKSGIFVGVDVGLNVGYTHLKLSAPGTSILLFERTKIDSTLFAGLKAGYQYYFNPWNGLRVYGDLNYGRFIKDASNDELATLLRYGVNIDYLINFSNDSSTWGFFVGAGYEFLGGEFKDSLKEESRQDRVRTNGIFMNVGFSKIYSNHHRMEFGSKIPFYSYFDYKDADGTISTTFRNITTLYISYSYSF